MICLYFPTWYCPLLLSQCSSNSLAWGIKLSLIWLFLPSPTHLPLPPHPHLSHTPAILSFWSTCGSSKTLLYHPYVFSCHSLYLKCLLFGDILFTSRFPDPPLCPLQTKLGLKADIGSKTMNVRGRTRKIAEAPCSPLMMETESIRKSVLSLIIQIGIWVTKDLSNLSKGIKQEFVDLGFELRQSDLRSRTFTLCYTGCGGWLFAILPCLFLCSNLGCKV